MCSMGISFVLPIVSGGNGIKCVGNVISIADDKDVVFQRIGCKGAISVNTEILDDLPLFINSKAGGIQIRNAEADNIKFNVTANGDATVNTIQTVKYSATAPQITFDQRQAGAVLVTNEKIIND